MAAVVAPLVRDEPAQCVSSLAEQATQGQMFGKRDLGQVLLRHTAGIEYRPREMDGENPGEVGKANVACDLALRSLSNVWEGHVLWRLLRISINGMLKLGQVGEGTFASLIGVQFADRSAQRVQGVQEATFFAFEVVNVFRLEHSVEAGREGSGRDLRDIERQGAERRLGWSWFEAAGHTFDLRLELPFKWEPLVLPVSVVVGDGNGRRNGRSKRR